MVTTADMSRVFERATRVSQWAVVQDVTGSIIDVGKFLADFQAAFSKQGLDSSLAGFDPRGIIVLYSDPRGDPATRMSVGLTVPAPLPVRPPLRVHRLHFDNAVSVPHTGPFEELGRLHEQLVAYSRSAGGQTSAWASSSCRARSRRGGSSPTSRDSTSAPTARGSRG